MARLPWGAPMAQGERRSCARRCAGSNWGAGRVIIDLTLPWRAGLSHMADYTHQDGVVPASALDFPAHRFVVGMGAQDVEGEASQGGEVFRRMVFPCPVSVL